MIEIQKYFRVHGKRCSNFGLPEPVNFDYENNHEILDLNCEKKIAGNLYKTLNVNQEFVVDTIMDKVNKFHPQNKNAFFVDGPGNLN